MAQPATALKPAGRPAVRMTWQTLLFAHWPLPVEAIRPHVPPSLEIDTFDGRAWVGLIPFTMPSFRIVMLRVVPHASRFHECNVRTYVTHEGEAGVYFFSLDAASRMAVWGARRFWGLNYHHARIGLRRDGDVVDYAVDRTGSTARLRCRWRAGRPRPRSRPGDLAFFLTERYMLYVVDRRGRPRPGRIHHAPWSLREAELLALDDGLVKAAGLTVPDEPPVLYHADHLEVEAWKLGTSTNFENMGKIRELPLSSRNW